MAYFDNFTPEDYRYILYPNTEQFSHADRLVAALQDGCEGVVDDELSYLCAQQARFPGYMFGLNSDFEQFKKQFTEATDEEIDYFLKTYEQLYFCLRKALENNNVSVFDLFFKSSAKHCFAYNFCEEPSVIFNKILLSLFSVAVRVENEYVLKKIIGANINNSMPLCFYTRICKDFSDAVIRYWIKKITVVPYCQYDNFINTPHCALLEKNKRKLLYRLLLKPVTDQPNTSKYLSIDNASFGTLNKYMRDDFALFLYEIGALRCCTRSRKGLYNQLLEEIVNPSYNYDRISTFKMICALYSLIFKNYDFGSGAGKQHFLQKVINYAKKQSKLRIEDLFKHILLFVDRNNEWMVIIFCNEFSELKDIPEYAEYEKESMKYRRARAKKRILQSSIFAIQKQRKISDCCILTHG